MTSRRVFVGLQTKAGTRPRTPKGMHYEGNGSVMSSPSGFQPSFRITNRMTTRLTRIERARGFLEAAQLSEDWLATQMDEVTERGKRAIKADVLAKQHGLNTRQMAALRFLLEHGKMTIRDYEVLCPESHRRSLQRDLKKLLEVRLVTASGSTNQQEYKLL